MTQPLPPDCNALFRGVLDSPRLPLPKLVLADWLDEHGTAVLAHGFRWCASYGRHPKRLTSDGPVPPTAWPLWSMCSRQDALPLAGLGHWFLPHTVALETNTPEFKAYLAGSHSDPAEVVLWNHFGALADGLEKIAAVVRLPRD